MMKSTMRPLQTLFKLVWTNVFEQLLKPKTLFRKGTGCQNGLIDNFKDCWIIDQNMIKSKWKNRPHQLFEKGGSPPNKTVMVWSWFYSWFKTLVTILNKSINNFWDIIEKLKFIKNLFKQLENYPIMKWCVTFDLIKTFYIHESTHLRKTFSIKL